MGNVNNSSESAIDNTNVVLGLNKRNKADHNKTYRWLRLCIPIIIYFLIIFLFSFVVPSFLVERTQVKGASMENTLYDGDDILLNKMVYRFYNPKRYDVIVFYPQGDTNGDYFVKRVIGLPGETVQIINGFIFINGDKLDEDYGKNAIVGAGNAAEPITLGKDEYFVLGDNRIISKDSRYDSVGVVKKTYIVGKAWLRVFPAMKFTKIK